MPQDNDAWARYRKKNAERSAEAKRKKVEAETTSATHFARQEFIHKQALNHEDLNKWVEQVPILIEQLSHLYTMYFQGIERRPPIEKRKLLESLMYRIQGASKTSTVVQFRAQTLVGQIQAQLERWDRQLRAKEKIKKAG